jgi:VWFA-related protein
MKTHVFRAVLAVTALLGAPVPDSRVAAQQTTPASAQPAPPMFRSGADVVAVDVTVVDDKGAPVLDLSAADFVVQVDGKSREVVSARVLEFPPPRKTAGPRPTFITPYTTNRPLTAGRAVMIVLDAGSFAPGEPKAALDAATRFVDTLAPEDRLAFATIPGGAESVEFTTDHGTIRKALRAAVGSSWDTGAQRNWGTRELKMGKTEALAWDRGNRGVQNEVTLRECGVLDSAECFEELSLLSQQLTAEIRSSVDRRLSALERMLEQLAEYPGPKWMILISGGFAFEFDNATPATLGVTAARAETTVHAIFVDTLSVDPFGRIAPASFRQDREFERNGLENIVGFTRGVVHRVVANATPGFDQISREMSALWQLGVTPLPQDLDGKGHKLDVEVRRKGLTVRTRPQFVVDPAARVRPADTWLESALRTPAALSALPIKVSTYSFRDVQSNQARVVVSADVGFEQGSTTEAAIVFEARTGSGRLVSSGTSRATSVEPGRPGIVRYVGALTLPAGSYTLRLAAVDQDGRLGNIDHPLEAMFRPAGSLRVSDLLVGEAKNGPAAENVPAEASVRGSALDAYFEVYAPGGADDALRGVSYRVELLDPRDRQPLTTAEAVAELLQAGPGHSVSARLKVGHLPSGEYEVHARVLQNGVSLVDLGRAVRIARDPGSRMTSGLSVPRLPATLPPMVPSFDKRSALAPQALSIVLAPVRERTRGQDAISEQVARTEQGRFVSSAEETAIAGTDPATAALLRGVGFVSEGRCDAASQRLRTALSAAPDLWSAAYLLGVCEAGRGRDAEAVGAWRTSLAQGGDTVPTTYEQAADGLLRLGRTNEALALLEEAQDKWPDSPTLARRMAPALAMSGRAPEAIALLEHRVATTPDSGLALIGIQLLVAAAEDGRPLVSADADRASLVRFARAYVAAGGPPPLRTELERWLSADGNPRR